MNKLDSPTFFVKLGGIVKRHASFAAAGEISATHAFPKFQHTIFMAYGLKKNCKLMTNISELQLLSFLA